MRQTHAFLFPFGLRVARTAYLCYKWSSHRKARRVSFVIIRCLRCLAIDMQGVHLLYMQRVFSVICPSLLRRVGATVYSMRISSIAVILTQPNHTRTRSIYPGALSFSFRSVHPSDNAPPDALPRPYLPSLCLFTPTFLVRHWCGLFPILYSHQVLEVSGLHAEYRVRRLQLPFTKSLCSARCDGLQLQY